jgi:hypothetical protein
VDVPRDLTPFPRPGERLLGGPAPSELVEPLWRTRYVSLLRDRLKLTRGTRILVHALLLVGVLAGAIGTGVAFYNVESGIDPDQVLGLQIGFSWIVVAIAEVALLGTVVALDAIVRGVRSLVRAVI